jgi:hypothetical protein
MDHPGCPFCAASGDTPHPRGGVRGVIPDKPSY